MYCTPRPISDHFLHALDCMEGGTVKLLRISGFFHTSAPLSDSPANSSNVVRCRLLKTRIQDKYDKGPSRKLIQVHYIFGDGHQDLEINSQIEWINIFTRLSRRLQNRALTVSSLSFPRALQHTSFCPLSLPLF